MENLAPSTDEVTTRVITDEQWVEMWDRLKLHVRKRYAWLNTKYGLDLDELVHQAILATMLGERRWPPIDKITGIAKTDVTLFYFLCEVIRSNVSHWIAKDKKLVLITGNPGCNAEEVLSVVAASKGSNINNDLESQIVQDDLTNKMLALVADDNVLVNMVKQWRRDPSYKPNELAELLDVDITVIRAAQKRLRKRLREFREAESG